MSIQSWSTRDENNIGCECINAKCQKWRMGAGWMTGSQRGVRTWRRPWAFCVFFSVSATCNADEWTVEWMIIENCNACHNPEYATEKLEWCINAAPDTLVHRTKRVTHQVQRFNWEPFSCCINNTTTTTTKTCPSICLSVSVSLWVHGIFRNFTNH